MKKFKTKKCIIQVNKTQYLRLISKEYKEMIGNRRCTIIHIIKVNKKIILMLKKTILCSKHMKIMSPATILTIIIFID
jgi:hypothetical protein